MLVPRVMPNRNNLCLGRIHKQGPRALRWNHTTCPHAAVKARGKLQRLLRRSEKWLGKGKAIVAVAHRRIKVILVLLARNETHAEDRAEKTRAKIVPMPSRARPPRDPEARWVALNAVPKQESEGARG